MPDTKLGIHVLLMSSCFLRGNVITIFLLFPLPPLLWPGCRYLCTSCWITVFIQQKQSLFCNELSAHLLESELPNHPYDAPLYKLHKVCKVFQLQSSQKCLDSCQRWSRCFWAQLVQRRSECTTLKLGPTAVGVYLRPFPESHLHISPA